MTQMPRLSFEKGNANLTWALSNMGLADLFKPGYSQLYDISEYKWLSVSDVLHKTYLDIKETHEAPVMSTASVAPAPAIPPIVVPHPNMKNLMYSPHVNHLSKQPHGPLPHSLPPHVPVPAAVPTSYPTSDAQSSANVNFDKPFIYFVFDNISGLIMVMGKVGREPVNYRLPI